MHLNAFGDDTQHQSVRQRNDRQNKGRTVRIIDDVVHENPVDLQDVDRRSGLFHIPKLK